MATSGKKGRTSTSAAKRAAASSRKGGDELKLKFEPRGPDQSALDELGRALLQAPAVREHVGRARHRLLSLELADDDPETKSARPPKAPERFRATIYDYTNNHTVRGSVARIIVERGRCGRGRVGTGEDRRGDLRCCRQTQLTQRPSQPQNISRVTAFIPSAGSRS